MTMPNSPLKEASPGSLETLFNKNPRTLTDEELTSIVVALRTDRARWDTAEKVKTAKKTALPKDISVDDLLKGH